jgi:anaerobic magnesium-protoporphyrin IX monomethyl ester cyclase
MKKIVLVQPNMGGYLGGVVVHPPLSLLYASAHLVKADYEVQIIDARVDEQWTMTLKNVLSQGNVLMMGCTVMSGSPIIDSLQASVISQQCKVPVIWGGAHPTCLAEETIADSRIDYVIKGNGSESFLALAECLVNKVPEKLSYVPGLYYKKEGKIFNNPINNSFEVMDWHDIPYYLIKDYSVYHQLDHDDIILPIYSVYGCPYKCSFCISPARYQDIRKKWVTLPAEDVADHIQYLQKEFGATYIYFYDEDSFVNLKHIGGIIEALKKRQIKIKLGFRGARINEIKKMDDEYISNIVDMGTQIMHIGLESGSQRILDIFLKHISPKEILDVNKKLAKNQDIQAFYNWIVGTPTETFEDLQATKNLLLQVVKDNPKAIIPRPNMFVPLPSTPMFDMAVEEGYDPPKTLDEWILLEQAVGDFKHPWMDKRCLSYIRLLDFGSLFMDRKVEKVTSGGTLFFKFARLVTFLYYPIIMFRLKHDLHQFFIEYYVFRTLEIVDRGFRLFKLKLLNRKLSKVSWLDKQSNDIMAGEAARILTSNDDASTNHSTEVIKSKTEPSVEQVTR